MLHFLREQIGEFLRGIGILLVDTTVHKTSLFLGVTMNIDVQQFFRLVLKDSFLHIKDLGVV